ncbi:DsrE/DsrF/DrsH-like family protein [Salinicoccus sp. HZC-1]|uniref:DsrE/DsrF/DrsH-like family protein n=1 Tax=Salinicoccus sp. HZC-1 TaxID=3385497 RepID=UPI00398AB27A
MNNNVKENYQINDADGMVESDQYLLDVREPIEFELGYVDTAKNISVNELETRLDELPRDKRIHVYCQRGKRGEKAVEILKDNGFDAVNLEEGYSAYEGKYDTAEKSAAGQAENDIKPDRIKIEASGLQCPGPILKVKETMDAMETGQQMEIMVTDIGFATDVEAWARKTGNSIIENRQHDGKVVAVLQKNAVQNVNPAGNNQMIETGNGATMVVFSGDLDKALASFVIATGAKSMGKDVTMFFTFWGLNIIKDPNAPKRKKNGLDKMFSKMMPKSASKLPISKMNMFGLGSKMIQYVMANKKVESVTEMIKKADELGIKMVACTMSMDVMAVDKEELLDNVEFGGVGTYLGDAENSNLNLFI